MAKITPFVALLLICFSSFLHHGFGLKDDLSTTSATDSSEAEIQSAGIGEDWFHWGVPHFWPHPYFHPHPWPFVHPPMPAGGFKWPHWPSVHPPMPSGGFKWPPKQWPHWPFVHPPMPAGGFKWPPKQWPHWPFVHPPMPAGGKSPPHGSHKGADASPAA